MTPTRDVTSIIFADFFKIEMFRYIFLDELFSKLNLMRKIYHQKNYYEKLCPSVFNASLNIQKKKVNKKGGLSYPNRGSIAFIEEQLPFK